MEHLLPDTESEFDIVDAVDCDPLLFGRSILGRRRWRKQRLIRQAVQNHRRVSIRSAHAIGKTWELASIVIEWLVTMPGTRVICSGPSHRAVKRGIWSEVRRAYRECANRGQILGPPIGSEEWTIDDGWDAAIISPDNPSSAHGAHGARVLIVIDEAQGVESPELWDAFDSLMTGEQATMILSGNPLRPQGYFYGTVSDPNWKSIRISGFDHPNIRAAQEIIPGAITQTWINEKLESWGQDDPRYVARVLGEFPDSVESQLIPLRYLESCADIVPPVREKRRIGLDVARGGGDLNVLVVLDESRTVIHVDDWQGDDLMDTAGRCVAAMKKHGVAPEMVAVDVVGLGAGVVDRMREAGYDVVPVNFGASPQGDWANVVGVDAIHANLKAELHDALRGLLRSGLISIPKRFGKLWSDLLELRYSFAGDGRMIVEDKERMRKRIGRSPDHSDALVIALGASGYVPGIFIRRGA